MYGLIAIALAVAIPFFCLFSFKAGVRFSARPREEAAKPLLPKTAKVKRTIEEVNREISARNIDNYYGPLSPQEDLRK